MNVDELKNELQGLLTLMSERNISESNMLDIKAMAEGIFSGGSFYFEKFFDWVNKNYEQVARNPELVKVIGNVAVCAMQKMPASLGLSYGDKFSNHKVSSAVVYAHRIKNPEMMNLKTIEYLDRLIFIDMLKGGLRSEFILKSMPDLGISRLKLEAAQASIMTKVASFMKDNDAEVADIISRNEDLLDFYLQENPSIRISIFNKMALGLEKITLSPRHFPGMAKLLISLIESLESTSMASHANEMYAHLVKSIAKMGAKPTYSKLGVLNEVIFDLLKNHGNSFTPTDSFMAAKSMNYSPEVISAIKESEAISAIKNASVDELFSAIKSTIKTAGTGIDIVNLFDIKLTEKQLYFLKKKHLMSDMGM